MNYLASTKSSKRFTMHSDIQRNFFDDIMGSDTFEDNRSVYQEIVYDQFEETLRSALPLFTKSIERSQLQHYIKEFMGYGAKSPFIWNMSIEFAGYIRTQLKSVKVKEQLCFDTTQTKLYMHPHRMRPSSKKSKERKVALSKTAVSLKLEKNYFVIYKNRFDNEVYILEITKTLSLLLKLLKNRYPFTKTVRLVSKQAAISYPKLLPLLRQVRDDFYAKGILE